MELSVRLSKVASYSGCESRQAKISHQPVASLGAFLVTEEFKRRQASKWAESLKLKHIEPRKPQMAWQIRWTA